MNFDDLLYQNLQLSNTNHLLTTEIKHLKEEIKRLKSRNSKNSSSPPSHDHKKNNQPSNNKGGAKKGHKASQRAMLPDERVTHISHCNLDKCPHCKHTLVGTGVTTFQQIELVDGGYEITNYLRHKYRCNGCKKKVSSPLPKGIGPSPYGPNFQAMISILTSSYHLSKRKVVSLINDLFQIPLSVGVISKIEHRTAIALKPSYEKIREIVLEDNSVVGADESRWRHSARNFYLWSMSNNRFSYFHIDERRNKEARDRLFGKSFSNPLITDRYAVYRDLEVPHQYCLSHILRDIKAFEDVKGVTGVRARALQREFHHIFCHWNSFKKEEISRKTLRSRSAYRRTIIKEHFEDGLLSFHLRFKRFAKGILQGFDCLWTYLRVNNMEPTNNQSERDLRPMVIWRKISHGTRVLGGLAFVSIVGSVVNSLKKQGKNLIDSISGAISNYFLGSSTSIEF